MITLMLGSQIVLKFNPSTHKRYEFDIIIDHKLGAPSVANQFNFDSQLGYGDAIHQEFRVTMRFANRPNHGYALHGKVSRAKSVRSEMVAQLNRSIFQGSFDSAGMAKKDSYFVHGQNGPYISINGSLMLGNYSFMNFIFPKQGVQEGTKWIAKITGTQYLPSGEMIWTNVGQEVQVHYQVKKITQVKGRRIVTITESLKAAIKGTSPADDHMVTNVRVQGEFNLDAMDGLIVDGRFERIEQYSNQLSQENWSIHRASK